jgi:ankyrin repeat protein
LIRAGNGTVLRELLDLGAVVNPGDQRGIIKGRSRCRWFWKPKDIPLLEAITHGQEKLAIMLVTEYGADVDVLDCKYRDALFLAVSHGMTDLVELLLGEANERPDSWRCCEGSGGHPAWIRAISNGHTDVLRLLIKASDRDTCNATRQMERHSEALQLAAELGNEAAVELILTETSCDPNFAHRNSRRPVIRAARNGHFSVVRMLLDTGLIPVESKGELDRTVLSFAAQHGACDFAKYLLGLDGINPDSQDEDGRTPLMHAIAYKQLDMVALLLESGRVAINRLDNGGNSALIISIKKDLTSIARALLKMDDINVHTQNLNGRTAMQIALDHRLTNVVELLLDKGAVPSTTDKKAQALPSRSSELCEGVK